MHAHGQLVRVGCLDQLDDYPKMQSSIKILLVLVRDHFVADRYHDVMVEADHEEPIFAISPVLVAYEYLSEAT